MQIKPIATKQWINYISKVYGGTMQIKPIATKQW